MLKFLSQLFARPATPGADQHRALIDAAIERTVDGTDRRLRAAGDYRRRLREPVECAVHHVVALVQGLPAAAEISRDAFGSDPRVRALFSSVEQLRGTLGGSRSLREFVDRRGASPSEPVYGLLVTEREERTVLGTELDGDTIRRDVMQVAVNFYNHRFLTPAASEAECRWELKKRAFDYLIERALERLTRERIKRSELEQQRRLLRRKLEAMRAGQWGLGAMIDDPATGVGDIGALEAEIDAIDRELGRFVGSALTLEQSIEEIADTLNRPVDWLAARPIRLRIDHRGILVPETTDASCTECEFIELYSADGIRRTVLPVRISCEEIPAREDCLKKAAHYLA